MRELTPDTKLPVYLMYPRFLLELDVNDTAKMVYLLLYDRARLSIQNGWLDEEGRAYMFTHRTVLSDDEIKLYREIMDPSMKMNEDVFRESCCLENVDMEYVAIEDINQLLCIDRRFNTTASFNRWIKYSVPVYVSLFGAREMRIIVNQSSLLEQIQALVLIHCEKRI